MLALSFNCFKGVRWLCFLITGGAGPGFFNNGFAGFPRYGGGDGAGPGFGGGFGGPAFGHSSGYGGVGTRGRGYGMGFAGRGFETQGGKRPFFGGIANRGGFYESQTGHSVHMRGLPYSATEDDIVQVHYLVFQFL